MGRLHACARAPFIVVAHPEWGEGRLGQEWRRRASPFVLTALGGLLFAGGRSHDLGMHSRH